MPDTTTIIGILIILALAGLLLKDLVLVPHPPGISKVTASKGTLVQTNEQQPTAAAQASAQPSSEQQADANFIAASPQPTLYPRATVKPIEYTAQPAPGTVRVSNTIDDYNK